MNARTAGLLLRLPFGPRRAIETVLHAAESGAFAADRALARALRSRRRTAVWRVWLDLSGDSRRRWASALLAKMLDSSPPIPDLLVDAAWADWLDEHDDRLWSLLESWGRPATGPDARSISQLALGEENTPDPHPLVAAAVRFDHPIGKRARARLLAIASPETVDLLCAAAVDSPDVAAFCVAHRLTPPDPVKRAVFFVRTGQHEQHRALDGDGALLALGYRAATAKVRKHLRTIMASAGDTELIRVVVTGERRDRVAEMSHAEIGYLVRHLSEHGRWDELRALARDLPVAKAATVARLLPDRERAESDLLSMLAGPLGQRLRATVDRLPRERLITYRTGSDHVNVSISPDSSELAVSRPAPRSVTKVSTHGPGGASAALNQLTPDEVHVETFRIGTRKVTHRFSGRTRSLYHHPVLHLGDEILLIRGGSDLWQVDRVFPDQRRLNRPAGISPIMRRSSGGAVLFHPKGLAFADRGADRLRYTVISEFSKIMPDISSTRIGGCAFATLPGSRLIACSNHEAVYVMDEEGEVIQKIPRKEGFDRSVLNGLSFLPPSSLALHWCRKPGAKAGQYTQIWEFPPNGEPHRTAEHEGAIRDRWQLKEWEGLPIDPTFASRILTAGRMSWPWEEIDSDIPWVQSTERPLMGRHLVAMALAGDMLVTRVGEDDQETLEVHSPHLPTARALLERPLLHGRPQDLEHVVELRSRIGDPAVRDALDLLETCLTDHFGDEIALGTRPASAGGPDEIALERSEA